jgi:Ca-activated chloride channel family protein
MTELWNNIDISFANPEFFGAFLLLPLLMVYKLRYYTKKQPSVSFSNTEVFSSLPQSFRQKTLWIPFVLRLMVLSILIIALARPQGTIGHTEVNTEGIDIVLSMDISTSMLAKDLRPNRLEAAKKVASDFVTKRPNDNIGLVIFSGESFSQCPLTTDHSILLNLIDELKTGMLEDGTAIGDGLATAVDRLKNSQAKSKVVILLTDGMNNRGVIFPLTAGEIAKTFGIRVYTIGVGKIGMAETPVAQYPNGVFEYAMREVKIDEETMTKIAEMTGGKYFRATDNASLEKIYSEIDELEKTIIKVTEFQTKPDLYWPLAIAAMVLFMFEWILRLTYYKTLT